MTKNNWTRVSLKKLLKVKGGLGGHNTLTSLLSLPSRHPQSLSSESSYSRPMPHAPDTASRAQCPGPNPIFCSRTIVANGNRNNASFKGALRLKEVVTCLEWCLAHIQFRKCFSSMVVSVSWRVPCLLLLLHVIPSCHSEQGSHLVLFKKQGALPDLHLERCHEESKKV